MEEEDDFEFQLKQEALEAEANSSTAASTTLSNSNTYCDPDDGTEYEWNPAQKAWFPKINDDFIAQYQASYGNYEEDKDDEDENDETETKKSDNSKSVENVDNTNQSEEKTEEPSGDGTAVDNKKVDEDQNTNSRKRPPEPEPQWFEVTDDHNTNVYVSNLPLDISEEDYVTLMKKCGLIMKDEKNQLKIKLYRDENGQPKGDGRCCYIKVESVDLALNILDGYQYRPGHTINVERAKFALKGEYDPSRKPKKKKSNKRDKEKQKKRLEKLFDWRPDKLPGERAKNEKTVVIKNMFDPEMFESDPKLILEYRADLREECEEKCGDVRRVDIYDRHPDGVATISFIQFEGADKCLELMNGRFFAGRKLDAQLWDGKTKFKVEETEEEIAKRIKQWDDFLEK